MYGGPQPVAFPPQHPPFPPTKCCGCIPQRMGCLIICIIWAAFSMYLSVLSFQNKSLFYSYMPQAATTVFGVVNIIMFFISFGGIFIIIRNDIRWIHKLSHAVFTFSGAVMLDVFINIILFITNRSSFNSWCITQASGVITTGLSNSTTSFNFDQDLYNCDILWQYELKFGIFFFILMLAFYLYWSLVIYSNFRVNRAIHIDTYGYEEQPIDMSRMVGEGVPHNPGLPTNMGFNNTGIEDRTAVILNNQRPSSKVAKKGQTKRRIDTFSFRNIGKSTSRPIAAATPMQERQQQANKLVVPFTNQHSRRNSQFALGFKLGSDGNIIDIENNPSSVSSTTYIDNTSNTTSSASPKSKRNNQGFYY